MIDRYVYRCRRKGTGEVVALASRSAEWSPRSVQAVIEDLESRRFRYLVRWESGVTEVGICEDPRLPGGRTVDAAAPDGRPGGLAALPFA